MVCSHLIRSPFYRTALLSLMTTVVFAQPPKAPQPTFKAPPEVEQALRARVTEFFQCHVDGTLQKAWAMVAEDTKEYYFAALKMRFESFKITGLRFLNDSATKASVDLETTQKMQRMEFRGVVVPVPMTTLWKVENGQWVWYRDPDNAELTPMGLSDLGKVREGEKTEDSLKRLTSPEEIQRRAKEILKNAGGLDKPEVTLSPDKPSTAQVIYHNAQPGYVKLVLDPGAPLAGFTATLDKVDVNANSDAVLNLSYSPSANGAGLSRLPAEVQVRLIVQPLNEVFPVKVKFGAPAAQNP